MRIIVRDNLGKDVTYDREWYINTDGKIFYYTGDIDGPLYAVDNDYTWEVVNDEWHREYLGKWTGLEHLEINYPSCCDGCSNNPKNGGSGICNCTLPYMQDPMLYNTGDFCMANNIDGYAYVVDNIDNLKGHKDNTNRIAEAIENTKQYIKR
jgi:hypothetical protein